ncbi:hypothetical protein ACFL5J_01575 [Thermodesulfobacteriota bacterium]
MEINGTSSGAATYAMKKALEMPDTVMNVVQDSAAGEGQTLAMKGTEAQPLERSAVTGKGKLVDVVV